MAQRYNAMMKLNISTKRAVIILGTAITFIFLVIVGKVVKHIVIDRFVQPKLTQTAIKTPKPNIEETTPFSTQSALLAPSPSPSPTPMSFADMNAAYGPCVVLPTLMYHHIQSLTIATQENHQKLTVDTSWFRKQMEYLRDKQYTVLGMSDLIAFFDNGTQFPRKSVLLTFDDAYDDFATDAVPILKEFGFRATLFVPTGLVENPGYLRWDDMRGFGSSILLANHTWSHHSMGASQAVDQKEISTADQQLNEHGYNIPKVFADPYGLSNSISISILKDYGYTVAFTTKHGSTLCAKQRLALPRIRIGNAQLNQYGL